MTVLTVGVGGLLSNAAAIATQMGGGARQTVAASIAQSRMDSLTSLSCATLNLSGVVSGTSLNRSVKEVWTVTSGKNIKTITVTITIPRRTNPLVYKTVIPCRG